MPHLGKFILMIVVAIAFVQCSSRRSGEALAIPVDLVQEGDIVFRRGEGVVSDLVAYNDADGKYSHVGVVARVDSGLVIVHAVPGEGADGKDRVRAVAISDFFAPDKAVRGEIMSFPLDSAQRRIISHRAVEKASMKVAFDHQYDLADTSKLYCSELLQLIFKHVGVDLAQGRVTHINVPTMTGDYIMPSDIHKNPNLKSTYLF